MLQSRDVMVKAYHHALKEGISTIHSEGFHQRRNASIKLILHLVMKGFFVCPVSTKKSSVAKWNDVTNLTIKVKYLMRDL